MSSDLDKSYRALGLLPGSPLSQVKEAFRMLSRNCHPDTMPIGSQEYLEALEEQKELNEAYEYLKRYLSENPIEERPGSAAFKKTAAANGAPQDDFTRLTNEANSGEPDSQYELGLLYEKGRGIKEDLLQAVSWYRRAGTQGHIKAQFRLGLIYINTIMKDYELAHQWWELAAKQGHVGSQYNLALMYEKGQGMKAPDINEAIRWYSEAARQGDEQAQAKLKILRNSPLTKEAETLLKQSSRTKTSSAFNEEKGRSFLSKKQNS